MGNGKGVCLPPLPSNLLHFLEDLPACYTLPYHYNWHSKIRILDKPYIFSFFSDHVWIRRTFAMNHVWTRWTRWTRCAFVTN